jgi:hypothetical protein
MDGTLWSRSFANRCSGGWRRLRGGERHGTAGIGAKVITHARYTMFQMAEVAVPQDLFRRILNRIDGLRPSRVALY